MSYNCVMKNKLHAQILGQSLSYNLRKIRAWVESSREAGLPAGVKSARLKKAREHAAQYRATMGIIKTPLYP